MVLFIYNFIMLGLQSPSGSTPPPPARPGNTVNGPNLPIDDNIWVLIAIGVIVGIYFIYTRNRAINKAS